MATEVDDNKLTKCLCVTACVLWFFFFIFLLCHWVFVSIPYLEVYDNVTEIDLPSNKTEECQFVLSLDNHTLQLCPDRVIRLCSIKLDTCCSTVSHLDLNVINKRVNRLLALE